MAVDANLTVADVDSSTLIGTTFRIATGYQNGFDELVFTNQLGITGSWNASNGTLTLSGTASLADYQTAMRSVAFQTAGDAPNTTWRYVEIIVNDGQDLSDPDTKIVQVTAVNDLPTTNDVTANGAENDPSVAITLTGSDIDGTVNNFRIDSLPSNGTLYLNAGLTMAVAQGFNYVATGEQLTLYFVPNINWNGQTTFQYSARDNSNAVDPTPGTATINITAVNDAPVLSLGIGGGTYYENAAGVYIDTLATVTDADGVDFNGGVLTTWVSNNGTVDDQLFVRHEGTGAGQVNVSGSNILIDGVTIGSFTGGNGDADPLLVTFNANADAADVQKVVRRISFSVNGDNPSGLQRTVSMQLTDGDGGTSAIDTRSENVIPTNDTPVVAAPGSALAATEQTDLAIHGAGFTFSDIDANSGTMTATLSVGSGILTVSVGNSGATISSGNGTGSVVITGNLTQLQNLITGASTGTILFNANTDAPAASTTITLLVNDGGNTGNDPGLTGDASSEQASASQIINITAVNDAPVLDNSGFMSLMTITEDDLNNSGDLVSAIIASAGGDRITDPDAGALEGIAISGVTGSTGTWQYNTGSGWTDVGTVSSTSALLLRATDSLRFVPNGLNGDTGTVLFQAWDQTSGTAGTQVDSSVSGGTTAFSSQVEVAVIIVTSVNDAPSGTDKTITFNEDATYVFTAADFGFTDPDGNSFNRVWIMSLPTQGQLLYNGSTFAANNWILTSDIDLGLLTFEPVADGNGTGYASFDFQVQDDGGTANGGVNRDATSNTITFDVTAQNDAPTASHGGTYTINEGDSLNLNASGSSDIDGDTLTYRWDLNNDAIYDIVTTSANITPAWSALNSYGIDDDGVYTIGLQVDDGNGGLVASSTTVTINNVAPTLTASGAATAGGGQTYTLTLTDVDPGNDTISQWIVNWGDGSIDTYVGDPSSVTHVYANNLAGFTFKITVSAIDEDGQYFEANMWLPAYGGSELDLIDGYDGNVVDFYAIGDGLTGHANVVQMANGNFLISGHGSNNVLQYQSDGTLVGTFVTAGSGGLSGAAGMDFGADGNLYVASSGTGKVLRFDGTTGAFIDEFISTGLSFPLGLTFGPDGDLYVASQGSQGVLKFDSVTGVLDASFNAPSTGSTEDITFGPDGNLYVSSISDGVVRLNGTTGAFIDNFVALGTGGLTSAAGVTFGPDGNLYVSDQDSNAVRRYDGTTGAYIDDYLVPGEVPGPAYMTFAADHQVTISNSNQSPTIATNTGDTVLEGSLGNVITTAMLNEGDPDDSGAGLEYTITSDVIHGEIRLGGVLLGLNDSFTQADIDAGLVTYNHDGSETATDSFDFSLADGGENGSTPATGTFNFAVTAVNDAPVPDNNAFSFTEGQMVVLTPAMVSASDVDNNDPDLVFTISNANHIDLRRLSNGLPTTTFTLAELVAGDIVMVHDGSESAPSFDISVGDGTDATTPVAASISFTNVNDAPLLDAIGLADETTVNTTTAGDQTLPRTVTLSGGNYVISWFDGTDAKAQIFDANGTPVGGELTLDDTTTAGQADITATSSGGFVAVWADSGNIVARQFDSSGVATGPGVVVATGAATIAPEIVELSGGKLAIVFTHTNDVRVQLLTSGMVLDGVPIIVPDVAVGIQTQGTIAATTDGGFVVAFNDASARDGESWGVYAQRFDAYGLAIGSNFVVNQTTDSSQRADHIEQLAGSNIVVTWRDYSHDGSGVGAYMRVFNASGAPVTSDIVLSQFTDGAQDDPNILALVDGSFVVTWHSSGHDGMKEVLIRHFAADGTPLSDETVLNTASSANQSNPQATEIAPGRLIVTWSSDVSGDADIVQRMVDLNGRTLQYTENDSPTILHDSISLIDFDDANLDGATIQITGGYVNGEDVLAFVNQNGITGNWNAASGTLALSGSASVADYEAALRSITYSNTSDNPSTATRTVSWSVTDGDDTSFTGTSQVAVTPVNDAPTGADHAITTDEDTAYTFTASDFGYGDVEGDAFTSIQITSLESAGTLKLSGADVTLNQVINKADIDAGNLVFTPAADANGTAYDSFGFTVNDGTDDSVSSYTMTVDVTPVLDAIDDNQSIDEDSELIVGTPGVSSNDDAIVNPPTAGYVLNYNAWNDRDGVWQNQTAVSGYDWTFTDFGNSVTHTTSPLSNYAGITAAYQLDGTSGAIASGLDPYSLGSATFELWIRPNVLTGQQMIYETGGSTGISLYLDGSVLTMVTKLSANPIATLTVDLATIYADPTAEFIQIAYTRDPVTQDSVLYVDGVARDSVNVYQNDWSGAGGAGLGQANGITAGGSGFLNGDIAIMRFYDTALDATEVQANFAAVANPTVAITAVNGNTGDVGNQITLASGALVTVNTDGSYHYDTNGAFDYLAIGQSTTDSFTYTLSDGNNTDKATVTITINGVNDAPVIANLAGDTLAYTEGDGAVVIEQLGDAFVSDVDASNFDTGTLTVSFAAGSDSADDVLSVLNQGTGAGQIGVSGSNVTYGGVSIGTLTGGSSGIDLVFTFNANATPAAVSALLKNITYENTDTDNPTTGARTVRYILTEGAGGTSAAQDATINVTTVNDAPSGTDNTVSTVRDTDYVFSLSDFGYSDVEGDAFTSVYLTTGTSVGTIFVDTNSDGNYDVGEELSGGATVLASDIAAGKLRFAAVAGESGSGYDSFTFQVIDNSGTTNGGLDTDASPNTLTIDVNDAHRIENIFEDVNGDAQLGDAVLLSNVFVHLYQDVDDDGLISAADTLYATTTTDVNGFYRFNSLAK
ncbi:MAG: cadherin-like domain-containing protein [Planctomycetaceae bacterium]